MKLIIKADDFGFTEGINLGIMKAHRDGIVQSTGVMVNMPHARQALQLARNYPELCVGLHVNLVVGKPCAPSNEVKSLLKEDGTFISSSSYRQMIQNHQEPIADYESAYRETEAQILKFFSLAGTMPEYLEGHAIRSQILIDVFHDLAKKYHLLHVSWQQDKSVGIIDYPSRTNSIYDWYPTHLDHPEQFFTSGKIFEGIADTPFHLAVFHPGYMDYELTKWSSFQQVRIQDLACLTSPKVKEYLESNQIELCSHRDLIQRT